MIRRALPLLFCCACASFRSAAPSSIEDWREYRSAHFVLRSDLPANQGLLAIRRLERTRAALIAAVWPSVHFPDEVTEVIVLRSGLEFEHLFGRYIDGIASPDSIALHGPPDRWDGMTQLRTTGKPSVLRHEMVHHLSDFVYPNQPRWFAEGLAQFLETIVVSDNDDQAIIGAPNVGRLTEDFRNHTTSIEDLLAWKGKLDAHGQSVTSSLYAHSWLFIHWLYNTQPESFARYLDALASGSRPEQAWSIAFAAWAPGEMDKAIYKYLRTGDFRTAVVKLPPTVADSRERVLTAAEVHVVRAKLARRAAGAMEENQRLHQKEAADELRLALSADPLCPDAIALELPSPRSTADVSRLRRSVEAHPDSSLAWRSLARASPEDAEAAYKKAIELDPRDPVALNGLAWFYVKQDRPSDALALAVRAQHLAPWSPAIVDTYANALVGTKQCQRGLAAEQHAIDLLSRHGASGNLADYERSLERLQAQCASPVGSQ